MKSYRMFITILVVASCLGAIVITHAETVENFMSAYTYYQPIPIIKSKTEVGNLNSLCIFLADQLERNMDKKMQKRPMIVTTFTNLDNIKETSSLGRVLAENLMHELQIRGFSVLDIRLVKDIIINESGEFSLSRDIQKIKDNFRIGMVTTGTYTVIDDTVIVNSRVIDVDTGIVVSSGQLAMKVIDSLLFPDPNLKVIKVLGGN